MEPVQNNQVMVANRRRRKRLDPHEYLKYALINCRKIRMEEESSYLNQSTKVKATSQNGFTFYYSVADTDHDESEDSSDEEEEDDDEDQVRDFLGDSHSDINDNSETNFSSFDDFWSAFNDDSNGIQSGSYEINDALIGGGGGGNQGSSLDQEVNQAIEEVFEFLDHESSSSSPIQDSKFAQSYTLTYLETAEDSKTQDEIAKIAASLQYSAEEEISNELIDGTGDNLTPVLETPDFDSFISTESTGDYYWFSAEEFINEFNSLTVD